MKQNIAFLLVEPLVPPTHTCRPNNKNVPCFTLNVYIVLVCVSLTMRHELKPRGWLANGLQAHTTTTSHLGVEVWTLVHCAMCSITAEEVLTCGPQPPSLPYGWTVSGNKQTDVRPAPPPQAISVWTFKCRVIFMAFNHYCSLYLQGVGVCVCVCV